MNVSNYDFKDILDFLSNKYDLSKEWIIRNAVYLIYLGCDGLRYHSVDFENSLLCEDPAFKTFNKFFGDIPVSIGKSMGLHYDE